MYDIVVVGRGVLGASTALALAMRSSTSRIVIVGDSPGDASAAAGAMLGCFGEVTASMLASPLGDQRLEMSVCAKKSWPGWMEQLSELSGDRDLRIRNGTLILLNSQSGTLDDDNLSAIIAAAGRYREPLEEVPTSELPSTRPADRERPLRALHLPDEGSVNASDVMTALSAALDAVGVHQIRVDATAVTAKSGCVAGVVLANGERLSSGAVVVCAGWRTQEILRSIPEVGDRVPPMLAGAGVGLSIETQHALPNVVIRTPNRSFACGIHLVPHSGDHGYIGATNTPGLESQPGAELGDVFLLINSAIHQIDRRLQRARISAVRVGNRPITYDAQPILGATSVQGLWALAGTFREGFHLSPFLATEVARGVIDGEDVLGGTFQVERPVINTWSRNAAVSEVVRHLMAAWSEWGSSFPPGWSDLLEELERARVTTTYERMGDAFILPPELYLAVNRLGENNSGPLLRNLERNATAWTGRTW